MAFVSSLESVISGSFPTSCIFLLSSFQVFLSPTAHEKGMIAKNFILTHHTALFCPSNLFLISVDSTIIHSVVQNFNLSITLDLSSAPLQTNDPPVLSIHALKCISNGFLLFHFHSPSLKDLNKPLYYQLQKPILKSYLLPASILICPLYWVG